MTESTYIHLTATNSGALNVNLAATITSDQHRFVNINRIVLVCDSTLNPINIQLPAISLLSGFTNLQICVNDNSGTSGTNAITITVADSDVDNILGQGGIVLDTDYYKADFSVGSNQNETGGNAWVVHISSCCANRYVQDTATGVDGAIFVTSALINQNEQIVVVRSDTNAIGTWKGAVMQPVVDYTITPGPTPLTTSTINFVTALVDADVMIQYYTSTLVP